MDILKELYYGNLNPSENNYRNDETYLQLFQIVRNAENAFLEQMRLTAEQEPLFDAMMDAHAELQAHELLQSFREGFRLGGEFTAVLHQTEERTQD